ncbi:arginase family protein [Kushneria aurantia]|uniref:Arginase family protein n=1 Tax=Kushneria aurantia TaxID=504092 RepID=A0ABV6G204_9GAMM|nr:arginase family protein [Kushneria aurantia]
MAGAQRLAQTLAGRLDTTFTKVGTPRTPLDADWQAQLASALPELRQLAETLTLRLVEGHKPLAVLPRCAAALATLPVIARHHPDACLIWLDAHGDLNTPASSVSGYLGGMVLTAAAELWDSGLGSGWRLDQVVLADGRELDQAELALITQYDIRHLTSESLTPEALSQAIGNRPVYLHLDCDLLAPGLMPTEYSVAGGPDLAQLYALCSAIGHHELIGLEVAEFEEQPDFAMAEAAEALCDALAPVYERLYR